MLRYAAISSKVLLLRSRSHFEPAIVALMANFPLSFGVNAAV